MSAGHVPGLNKLSYGVLAAIDSRTDKMVWEVQLPTTAGIGRGGVFSTAGGLVFQRRDAGGIAAYDAKTGSVLWTFQTGYAGGVGTAMSYELDGQQYIAAVAGTEVWAFRLGGSIAARPAPKTLPPSTDAFAGPIEDTDAISTSSVQQMNWVNSVRYYVDEYSVSPYRIRVKVGEPVTFGNNGSEVHEFAAPDGSWTTGRLLPDMTVALRFDKPGAYTYICKNHPWTYGQIIVVDKSSTTTDAPNAALTDNVALGKAAYVKNCSSCHMPDLSGNDQVQPTPPALVGTGFLLRWQGRTAEDLFDKIRTTMPTGNPASLDKNTYLNLTAYLLQANQFPTVKDLDEDSLRAVNLNK